MPKVICKNLVCDNEYYVKPALFGKGQKQFCSRECKNRVREEELKSRWNTICLRRGCGNKYYASPAKNKKGLGKYCSHECYGLDKRGKSLSDEHKEKIGIATKKMWEDGVFDAPHIREAYAKQGRATKGSKWTDKQKQELSEKRKGKFPRQLHTPEAYAKAAESRRGKVQSAESNKKRSDALKGRKFSVEHRANLAASHKNRKASSYFPKGEKNPNWKGGISNENYPGAFNKTIKDKIRDRDANSCVVCKYEQHGKAGVVHHLNANKNDNVESNLIFLCRRCHAKVHSTKGTKDLIILAFRSMLKY